MEEFPRAPIFVCPRRVKGQLAMLAEERGWRVVNADELTERDQPHVVLVEVAQDDDVVGSRRQFPHALIVAQHAPAAAADLVLEETPNAERLHTQVLRMAYGFWRKNLKVNELVREVGMRRQRMHQLNEISLALTTRMGGEELLATILTEARRIAGCEGASLFLIEPDDERGQALVFKLAQNDAVDFAAVEARLPLTSESIAGYVAVHGQELNIRDVYTLSTDLPYQFNRSFDDRTGYRTKSILAIPMRDHRGSVVGVLQFINKKSRKDGNVIFFGEETAEILRAIGSQAAVSLQKDALLSDINQLFESFVQASVQTIEKRDPATSGHSARVAETTVALLGALPNSGDPRFSRLTLSSEHIREVRYAALLHDFGKIGVPEAVLVKANKLSEERLEVIRYRFELQKERLRKRAIEQELELFHHNPVDIDVARRRVHKQLDKQLSALDDYYDWVVKANTPNVLDEGDFTHLAEIRDYAFRELDGTVGGVITDDDVLALSVRRGSLTPGERRAIQSHVVHTTEFLAVLPWPPELKGVPSIAGAHHERLDGSGYPQGLVGEQIPLASRVMAVCDVYDALTAMDRPYKSAISKERAFDVLADEARRGLLDDGLVKIFIASGSYRLDDVANA
jgi:HD-GYP domain-containing protein (c-di-GMP phosphodiesterase class II)